MKAVMVDGPKSGEVISCSDTAGLGEIILFAIPQRIDLLAWTADISPYGPTFNAAIYRWIGNVRGCGQIIDVYVFEGMQK